MILIPFIYFSCLTLFFWKKEKHWNIGSATSSILVLISLFAILIDILNLYGEYGINIKAYSLLTLLLYCFQWTITLLPFHYLSRLQLKPIDQSKEQLFTLLIWILIITAFISLISIGNDVIQIISSRDFLSVKNEHYDDLDNHFDDGKRNYFMVLPLLLMSSCFQVLSIILSMYIFSFDTKKSILGVLLLIISTIGIFQSIKIAGRSAPIYWMLNFYIIYALFSQYIEKSIKKKIGIIVGTIAGLIVLLILSITLSRFDDGADNALNSFIGYAGQSINNFCAVFSYGDNSPHSTERIFPLLNKLFYHHQFSLVEHYASIENSLNIIVHNFSSFGGEIYLDLGWVGYIVCIFCIALFGIFIKYKWQSIEFYKLFILSIFVTFYTYGLFAWPFVGHYTTAGILLMLITYLLFKYKFKFK